MSTNRLIDEKSPYLLQHAHNPVDWYPWGEEAFEAARRDDKPIFLSIGYSTCHWCHVMERESFESEEVAETLNRYFIPIKVDREERPDVDRIYMAFVQASSGGGGWPMSVWLTPDRKPFYGGTYFPPDNRYGRPGFKYVLEQLAAAWQHDRQRILQSSLDVIEQLKSAAAVEPDLGGLIDAGVPESCFYYFRRTFDARFGGFGNAPKFPRPSVFNFLLRYHYRTHTDEALEMTLKTLREMARGGMNDQLAGGFHRYSVDARWFVPHFEKMLYDQAQLAISYLEAFQVTQNSVYSGVARTILDYVLRDMSHPDGGFYSAEDADSVIDPAEPNVKGEGAFYIWSAAELEELLGQPAAAWFSHRFGVQANGNVAEDPHNEFTGKNILFEAHSVEETAAQFQVEPAQVQSAMEESARKLLERRAQRVRPHLDDKVLTAWNGLMISAFAKGAQVLADARYLEAARRAVRFVEDKLTVNGALLRRFRDGEAAIPAFLDDYSMYGNALIDMYETGFDPDHLRRAVQIAGRMLDLFEDREHGGFFSTAEGDASLVMRMKEDYDGAEPSGNSMACTLLLRLAHVTGDDRFATAAQRTFRAFASRLKQVPAALPQMLAAFMQTMAPPRQVVFAGEKESAETSAFLRMLRARYLPNHAVLFADAGVPAVEHMTPVEGRTTAYICENFSCQLPMTDVAAAAQLLE